MRLRHRISLAAVILVTLTGIAIGVLSFYQLSDTLTQANSRWSASMSEAVAKAVTTGTLKGDKVSVRNVLRRVAKTNEELVYLLVADFKNEVFTSTFPGVVPAVLAQSHENCPMGKMHRLEIEGIQVNDISYPLINGLEAHLHVGINQAFSTATLTRASLILLLGGLLVTVVAVLFAIYYGQRISRPITELATALTAYGQGLPFRQLGDVSKADHEIRELHDSFHNMVQSRERSVQELNTLAQQLKSVVGVAPIILFSFDKDGIFTMSEGAALKNLGLQPGQVVGQSLFDVYRDYPDILEKANRVLTGESQISVVHVEDRILDIYWKPIVDERQQVEQVLGVAVDITERELAEQELRSLNEELEQRVRTRTNKIREQATLLERIHDSVVTTDMQGVITGWNKGAERLFGYSAEEAIDKNIAMLYPDDQLMVLSEEVIAPLQAKGEHEVEIMLQRKSGQRFEGHLSLSLLRNEQGEAYSMVGYTLDISDRKQAERNMQVAMHQAEEASRAKSEFLSRMSHELRTPMNAILGFSQLLEQNVAGNLSNTDLDCVNEVLRAGHHLLELINEVLDLSRIESGKVQITLETLDLAILLRECVSLMRPLAEKRNVSIEFDMKTVLLVRADHMRLKQVLLNLLSNAVKYNHEGGKVSIYAEPRDVGYRLSIADTGPGIPDAMRSRVFEPFDRLDADTTVEGTGIGLSLSRSMMECMGGNMGFSSVKDEGCTFWLDILPGNGPLNEALLPSTSPTSSSVDLSMHKVLYVEDNPANLRLVMQVLKKLGGIQSYNANSASLALDLIHSQQFDLILLDINLAGDEDGYDILARLRAEPATRDIPVIAISANANPHEIERGLAAGFDQYITKPIDVKKFSDTVCRILK